MLSNVHHCDGSRASIDSTSVRRLRRSLSASELPSLQSSASKWDIGLKLGDKSMVTQNESPAIYLIPLKDVQSGNTVSMTSGNGDSNCHTVPQNVDRHVHLSGGTLSRRVMSRKGKFHDVCSFESSYPSQKRGVPADKLACLVKESSSLVSLDEQLSPCCNQKGLQSFSDQTSHSIKELNGDVLKDTTNALGNLTTKYQKKCYQTQDLTIYSEGMCPTDCTGSCLSLASHCLEESTAVLMQEHKMIELSQEVCNSDMERTKVPRCTCCDADDSCNSGCCAVTTECRDMKHVDVNTGTPSTGSSSCDRSGTQAGGYSDCISAHGIEIRSCRFRDVLEPPDYPRPLSYTHTLTRSQFQNHVKSIEGKVYLDVNDILSYNDDFMRPEPRTRSMKAKRYNLKKLLQDMMSYPTVVLCRIDDKIQEQSFVN